MDLNPVIERELRLAMKGDKSYKGRVIVASIAIITAAVMLLDPTKTAPQKGPAMFKLILVLSCYTALFQPVHITADCLSRERRSQTLGLLLLTGLSPFQLFLSKLSGALVICLSNLIVLLPVLGISFVTGGVSFTTFLAAVCLMPILLFLSTAFGLLGSALCKDESQAMIVGYGLAAGVCLLPHAIHVIATLYLGIPLGADLLLWSPTYAFQCVWTGFGGGVTWTQFMGSAAISSSYAAVALICACIALGRAMRADHEHPLTRVIKSKWLHRKKMDESNLYGWLLTRNFRATMLPWIGMAMSVVAWVSLEFCFPWWGNPIHMLGFALLASVGVLSLVVYAAVQQVGFDRQSGTFEQLLTTPIPIQAITVALFETAWRRFRKLLIAGIFLNVILMAWGINGNSWSSGSVLNYFLAWSLIPILSGILFKIILYSSVWIVLNTGRAAFSMIVAIGLSMALVVPAFVWRLWIGEPILSFLLTWLVVLGLDGIFFKTAISEVVWTAVKRCRTFHEIFETTVPVLGMAVSLPVTLLILHWLVRDIPKGLSVGAVTGPYFFVFLGIAIALLSAHWLQKGNLTRRNFRFLASRPIMEHHGSLFETASAFNTSRGSTQSTSMEESQVMQSI